MTDGRQPQIPASGDLPSFTIQVNGEDIPTDSHVMSVKVFHGVNRIPAAIVTLLDGDVARADFPAVNSDTFVPGNEIEILMGYHRDEIMVFKGVIVSHQIRAQRNKPSILNVECRHRASAMTLGRRNRYFEDMTDSDIMEEILRETDLTTDIQSTDEPHAKMVQYYATDWDFLVTRADANGRLVILDQDTVNVNSPDTDQEPVVQLVYGATLFAFEAGTDARHQSGSITSSAWQYNEQDRAQEESTEPDLTLPGNLDPVDLSAVFDNRSTRGLQHGGTMENHELKSWADAALVKSRLSKILGKVVCQGKADIKPGTVMDIQGIGERFSGNAFVGSVTHILTPRNWESHVQIGLSPSWFSARSDISDIPSAGLLPPVHGLQVGVVTDLEDPQGEFRVRVRMPVMSTDEDGIWCRMAQLDAGDDRTLFFRPEIDDEVVLGFLNNDPRHPVVLGSLHSSARPSPIDQTGDNDEKGVVTRDGLRWVLKDTEKSITLETPDGKILFLNDDQGEIHIGDENSNVLILDRSGITMESQGDINIKTTGDINLEGTNITCKATASMSAEGSAGADLKSGATTTIRGSLVQIN